jgi:hypothetical protein
LDQAHVFFVDLPHSVFMSGQVCIPGVRKHTAPLSALDFDL